MMNGSYKDEDMVQDYLDKYLEPFMELSKDDKGIVANKLFDIWLDEKIDDAERKLVEEPAPILSMPSGGIHDIYGKTLILAMLLHEEQQVKENEVFALVEQVLFDMIHYLDEREAIIKKAMQ